MTNSARRHGEVLRRFGCAAAMLSCLGAAAGCRDAAAPTGGAGGTASRPALRYTVRAEVVKLPDPRSAEREIAIRHEAIDDFVDASGTVVGMDAMVMPFGVASAVPLGGLAPGDKVEVLIAVDWARPAFGIERLRKLPPDTVLEFGPARPGARRSGHDAGP